MHQQSSTEKFGSVCLLSKVYTVDQISSSSTLGWQKNPEYTFLLGYRGEVVVTDQRWNLDQC